MITIAKNQIDSPEMARRALILKYGSIKNSCVEITKQTGSYIDYNRLHQTMFRGKLYEPELSAVCQDLGIKPEILTGGLK